jgi:signal transduction histidine kinase
MPGFKDTSIRNKLIIIQAATAFVAVLICCIIFVVNNIGTIKASAEKKMHSMARIVGENAASPLLFVDQDAANQILLNLNREPDIQEAVILDTAGKIFARYVRTGNGQDTTYNTSSNGMMASPGFSGNKLLVRQSIAQDKEVLGTVILRAELSDINHLVSNYIMVAALVLCAGLVAALIISTFLQRAISSQLLSLVAKTKEVTETGNYALRFSGGGKDEIGILAGGFNAMLNRIEKMEKSLKESNIALKNYAHELERSNKELEEFAYISSHDMKSPITSLQGLLTLMEQENSVKPESADLFKLVKNSARQMQKTINALNEIIAFRKTLSIERQKIAFQDALEEVKIGLYEMVISSGAIINARFSDCPYVNYPPVHLKSILQNLLTNAIKYKQEGKPPVINMTTICEGDGIILEVSDQGMGIDMKRYKDKLYGLFQRFHTHADGMGIGLHMIHSIIESYNGKISIESEVNKGTTFKIYFSHAQVS